jgi:sugar O-acyltransferase (sialic acid O-acetyltransferase NeuD family)
MKLALFGYGGHAREVASQMQEEVTFFVDDEFVKSTNGKANPISEFDPNIHMMLVAISDPKEREEVIKKMPPKTLYFTYIHPSVHIMDDSIEVGIGSFIGANSILTTNIKIGDHALLNRGNHIGHDCRIGNYFSAMPGSIISGNVNIGNNVYIGSNSTVKEKMSICDNVVIGMSSCSVKPITQSGIYVGTPCKRI